MGKNLEIGKKLKSAKHIGIVGIGVNSEKLVDDFIYIFEKMLNIGDRIGWAEGLCLPDKKHDFYICCTYEREGAVDNMAKAGLRYKEHFFFAEDCFFLLDDLKGSRIALLSYPGTVKGWIKALAFGYAAKHGKLTPRDRYKDILSGRYSNNKGNRYGRHLQQNSNGIVRKFIYAWFFFLGSLESLPQLFPGKRLNEKYEYICFESVADAIRYKKDNPDAAGKVITVEELKAHTMASLYMRAVYFDRRQNGCACDTPLNTLWIGEHGTTRLCGCPDFLDISCGNVGMTDCGRIWNSPLARIMRLSVINNTYTFCSRDLCRMFNANKDGEALLERKADVKEKDHPGIIKVANDYVCNLHCPSCRKHILAKNDNDTAMEIEECTHELLESGWLDKADRLVVGASGESFLSKNYRRILYEGVVKRNSIYIMTNGTLFTQREWEQLKSRYEHIGFSVSVDAATKETYAKVRCGGNFDRLMENMEFLSGLRRENKVEEVTVNMVVQKANYREIPDFIRWAKRLGFDTAYLSNIWNWGTYSDEEFENNVSMFDRNGQMKPELAAVLEDPVCRDPIVDMRWAE